MLTWSGKRRGISDAAQYLAPPHQYGQGSVRLVAITNAPLLIDTFGTPISSSTTTTCSPSASTAARITSADAAEVLSHAPRDRSGKTKERGYHSHSSSTSFEHLEMEPLSAARASTTTTTPGDGAQYDGLPRGAVPHRHLRALPPHGPGSTIILLDGSGFSMMWRTRSAPRLQGRQTGPVKQFDWKEGTLVVRRCSVPPAFQQRKTPARFVKLGG